MDELFRQAGCRGWLCAMALDSGRTVELGADDPVVSASVLKVPVAVEFFRQVAAGQLDPAERVRLRPGVWTPGPTGISNFLDEVEMSLRDLVRMMLVISDNAATDAVLGRVGVESVNATMAGYGLTGTVIVGGLRQTIVDSIGRDLGFAGWAEFTSTVDDPATSAETVAELRARLPGVSALDPTRTTRTTAREMATLLRAIWPDERHSLLRGMMAQQVTRHRIAVGFPYDVSVAAKTGGLLGVVRNEVGVVSYPDGGQYAVAVFTRADRPHERDHEINEAIGAASAQAVRQLRAL
jgi:beta-lactamase class A